MLGTELSRFLGSRPVGDISHKPGGRLPLLSTRPTVTFPDKQVIPVGLKVHLFLYIKAREKCWDSCRNTEFQIVGDATAKLRACEHVVCLLFGVERFRALKH